MPLHVWLPGAHASSPSHVSAFMSGVMITMGVYGLVRVTSFFDAPPLFWGFVLLGVGAVSAVLGVAFAIAQGDLKRLLAYSTVEGAGVVALGLGTALVGRSLGRPELVTLGLAGALLHVWNHAAFKSLLFFGAGAVIHATGTREIDGLGGLARRMPLTASTFLAGSIALCGLPPSNGFVSELLVYLGLFHTALLPDRDAWMAGAFGVPVLALVGAVSLACFVKAYGVVFLGAPRGDRAERAHDPGPAMTGPALALGGACAVLGLAPSLVAPLLDRATAAWSPGGAAVAPSLASLAPLHAVSVTSACLVVAIVAAALLLRRATGGARARRAPTWDCGYAMPTARMQYTGSSFAATLVTMFAWALRPRIRRPVVKALFPIAAPSQRFSADVPDAVLERALAPALRAAGRGLAWFRWVQQGNVRLYVLYIVAAAVLAVVLLPR